MHVLILPATSKVGTTVICPSPVVKHLKEMTLLASHHTVVSGSEDRDDSVMSACLLGLQLLL